MTPLSKLAALIKRLDDKTSLDELEWTEPFRDVFETKIGSKAVRVSADYSEYDPEQDPDYYFVIADKKGETIDVASDGDLSEVLQSSFKTMQSLYRGARRRARGVDGLLDELNAELDKDEPL